MNVQTPGAQLKLEGVVFDLDDTLYLERDYVKSGFLAVSSFLADGYALDKRQVYRQLMASFEAGIRDRNFNVVLEEIGLNEEALIPRLVQVYREHKPSIVLLPDAAAVLPKLRQKYRIGLMTDGYKGAQRNKLAALGIAHQFDAIVLTDDYGREHWKPSPVPYTKVLEKLSFEGPEVIYVGDNPHKDFIGAKSVHMGTLRIRRNGGLYKDITFDNDHEADCEIWDLRELPDILARWSADG